MIKSHIKMFTPEETLGIVRNKRRLGKLLTFYFI